MNLYIFLGVIALLVSALIAYYQYFFKVKRFRFRGLLFTLKAIALFLILLLLINPTIEIKELTYEKPILNLLVDNSKSIRFFKEDSTVKTLVDKIKNNDNLRSKFEVKEYQFGKDLNNTDTLYFSKSNTNIYNALQGVHKLSDDKISVNILISDGNQTLGRDYEYFKSKEAIYPILVGDTATYTDISITQLNVNKYSFLDNKFPVEAIINYEGKTPINTQFTIANKGRVIYRETISLSPSKNTQTIEANLAATTEGFQYYTASIQPIKNEKNTNNNYKTFSVDVINEQTKILILSSVLHPDLGALKKSITTNKQNAVDVFQINKFTGNINDYQLIILYQPNNLFSKIITDITNKNRNYLLISGLSTEWNFLNSKNLGFAKNAINQPEDYLPNYNQNYLTFFQEDIGFNNFPPLKDKFGKISLQREHQILLYQNVNGVATESPMLATFSVNNQKTGVLFGENIWKWRANSFLNTNSFSDFDTFIRNLVQYLSSTKKRNRLEVNADAIYAANSTILITAFYRDKNYKFDNRANLEITLTNNETNAITKLPFSLNKTAYQVNIENLKSGDYNYEVAVLGQNLRKSGRFKVSDYEIEEQFTNANASKMNQLALNSGGKLFYKNQIDELVTALINNKNYVTIQKQIVKEKELINWKWILFIIVILFTTEWFIRKYIGKI